MAFQQGATEECIQAIHDEEATQQGSQRSSPNLQVIFEQSLNGIAGFSLAELLGVLAIVSVLATLIVPLAGPLVAGRQLTNAAQMLVEQLSLARQTAVARNCKVEVRFYNFAKVPDSAAGSYCALQLFQDEGTGSKRALGKLYRLPQSILIDSHPKLSSMIGSATDTSKAPALCTGQQLGFPVPQIGNNYSAVCFNFLPGGSTDLPLFQEWFLTLHNVADGDGQEIPPRNFITLQLDPSNGHIQIFRP